jgi:hypothetical protein
METAYGSSAMRPTPAEVVEYLEWCRTFDRHR